ncbi:hypothetical protein NDI76_18115 [Halogeometricum sp. S1BR25-6]|uniref:CARDB domain-containing protein n=1 Tax=Halogeometricum salsisoli TaxID=2950536 RepID=A0ABU2GKF0_9EURY|nr:hypothetical protein [Halogeometricum sp. S1BR25-6]MDS0300669.1 hypothetical protein [Halogeometricum sp. S1BR25-6]
MNSNPHWSSTVLAFAFVFVLCSVSVGTAAAGGAAGDVGPTPTATDAATETPQANRTTETNSTPTSTPPPGTVTATETTTESPPPADATVFVVSDLDAPESLRAGDDVAVNATVTNRASANGTETLRYSLGGTTIASRTMTLAAGESATVEFAVPFSDVESALGSTVSGTYVHGVRNESGAGAAARLRVTPDVDLSVERFDAPTEISHNESYIVLATVRNPGDVTITRNVDYAFAGEPVVERAVTVAAGDDRQVAFEMTLADAASVVGPVENETTYDHGVRTGDSRAGGAVRVVRGPSADASALAVESFEAPDDVRPGDDYRVNLTVRNVDTADFEGQLGYRVDGAVVATDWTHVPIGERRTVSFRVTYDDVADAAVPLSSPNVEHGVYVGSDAVETRPVTVHVPPEPETATPEPPTFTADEPLGAPTATPADAPDDADADTECQRGFFTACGGTALSETSLTLVGIFLSGLGIVFQLSQGRR